MNMVLIHLLEQVSNIRGKHEEIAKVTGERFNVFNILGVATSEVRMHSAFLAELLNPRGSHGCGCIFLKIFLNMVSQELSHISFGQKLQGFDVEKCRVDYEYYVGRINEDDTEGGRIDILIRDGDRSIIIENKVYAHDQPNQLIRYNNFSKEAPILYLTLDGKQPSHSSCGDLQSDEHFRCISYQKEIVIWLEKSLEKAVNYPMVRETIKQYMHLIKQLTHQTTSKKMQNEILENILNDGAKLDAAQIIAENWMEVKKEAIYKLGKEIAKQKGYSFKPEIDGFSLRSDKLPHPVYFYCNKDFESNFVVGYVAETDDNPWLSDAKVDKSSEWNVMKWSEVIGEEGIKLAEKSIAEVIYSSDLLYNKNS